MRQKPLVIIISTIIILGFIIAAIYLLILQPGEKTVAPTPTPTAKMPPKTKQPVAVEPAIAGSYQVYSDQAFAAAKGTRLLFFHAPWCPQCRQLDADILKTKLPDNLAIFKVDYDTATSLRKKYGVTLQTTIVNVDQNGEMINKIVAYNEPSYATLQKAFNL